MDRRNKKPRNRGQMRIWVAIVLAAGGIGLLMYASIRASARQYVHVDELVENGDRFDGARIKLSGEVVKDTASYDQKKLILKFEVKNTEEQEPQSEETGSGEATTRIVFEGTKPDAFKEGGVVIVKGTYDRENNLIRASTLQAKCPSRYKKKGKENKEGAYEQETDKYNHQTDTSDEQENKQKGGSTKAESP